MVTSRTWFTSEQKAELWGALAVPAFDPSAGLGVALAMPLIAEGFLIAGRIIPCSGGIRATGETECLYRPATSRSLAARSRPFAVWLRHEIGASLEEFEAFALEKNAMLAPG